MRVNIEHFPTLFQVYNLLLSQLWQLLYKWLNVDSWMSATRMGVTLHISVCTIASVCVQTYFSHAKIVATEIITIKGRNCGWRKSEHHMVLHTLGLVKESPFQGNQQQKSKLSLIQVSGRAHPWEMFKFHTRTPSKQNSFWWLRRENMKSLLWPQISRYHSMKLLPSLTNITFKGFNPRKSRHIEFNSKIIKNTADDFSIFSH